MRRPIARAAARATTLATLAALSPGAARADDAAQDSVTVVPWNQAALVFTEKSQKGVVEYTHLWSGYSLSAKASAPIDEDTRIGNFAKNGQPTSGFAASLQLGFDRRAEVLAGLVKALEEVSDQLGVVQAPPPRLSLRAAFATRHGINDDNDAHVQKACELASIDAASCQGDGAFRAMCQLAGAPCTDEAEGKTHEAAIAARLQQCQGTPPAGDAAPDGAPSLDACFAASWLLSALDKEVAVAKILTYAADQQRVDAAWRAFASAEPQRAAALLQAANGSPAQVLVEHAGEIAAALKALLRQKALERRDLLLTGAFASGATDYSLTFDGTFSYDRMDVFQDDLAAAPVSNSKYVAGLGANLTLYPAATTGLALTLRAGAARTRDPDVKTLERCQTFPSTDPAAAGKACDAKALFRAGDAPGAATSGNLRAAVTYQYRGRVTDKEVIPGVELRGGLEGLGAKKAATGRLTLFGTPIIGSTAARVGVALDVAYAINRASRDDSRWTVTPMFFVGASFSSLMSSP